MNVIAHCSGCDATHALEDRVEREETEVCPDCGDPRFEMEIKNTRDQSARARIYNVLIDVDPVRASSAGAIASEHTTLISVKNSTIGRLQRIDGVSQEEAMAILTALDQ